MGMVRCAECGRAVSQHATSCPGCGVGLEPVSDERYARARAAIDATRAKDGRFTLLVAGVVVGLLVIAVILGPSREERREAEERDARRHVESLPEQQRERESERFWRSAGLPKAGGPQ